MKTRSALVYFPGYVFEPQALSPSRTLATLAGALLDAGHEIRILDFGTIECADRLMRGKVSSHLERLADESFGESALNPFYALQMLWRMRAAERAFRIRREAMCREVAHTLAEWRGLHFAAFMLNNVDDMSSTLDIVRPLRELRPKLRIVVFGALVGLYADALAHVMPEVDCFCVAETELGLVSLAEKVESPASWNGIPNLAVADGGRIHFTCRSASASLASLAGPVYEPDVYPALKADQKLRIFEIEDCRSTIRCSHAEPQDGCDASVRIRPVAAVCHEIWRIGTLFGARAFHFNGRHAPASHVAAVANELVRRGMDVRYTREWETHLSVPVVFPSLSSSGCAGLSFPVDTGSQRLLEDFYGRTVTVSHIERVVSAAKSIGIPTLMRLTYPCPADDYHTHAETLRLIDRTKPAAAVVGLPRALPGSAWHRNAQLFGFRVDASDSGAALAKAARRVPLPTPWQCEAPTETSARSNSELLAARATLVRQIEDRGIPASVPETYVRLAWLGGFAGREREFALRAQLEFLRGDAMGIAALVDQFNEAACVPAKGVALRTPDYLRLAVGT